MGIYEKALSEADKRINAMPDAQLVTLDPGRLIDASRAQVAVTELEHYMARQDAKLERHSTLLVERFDAFRGALTKQRMRPRVMAAMATNRDRVKKRQLQPADIGHIYQLFLDADVLDYHYTQIYEAEIDILVALQQSKRLYQDLQITLQQSLRQAREFALSPAFRTLNAHVKAAQELHGRVQVTMDKLASVGYWNAFFDGLVP
ncbi:hypothetical protein H4R35_003973 [Dimargaris xerosporica]|nr:hypothetical protein H4R35_003973 [Dimargaris xerosporica]